MFSDLQVDAWGSVSMPADVWTLIITMVTWIIINSQESVLVQLGILSQPLWCINISLKEWSVRKKLLRAFLRNLRKEYKFRGWGMKLPPLIPWYYNEDLLHTFKKDPEASKLSHTKKRPPLKICLTVSILNCRTNLEMNLTFSQLKCAILCDFLFLKRYKNVNVTAWNKMVSLNWFQDKERCSSPHP